MHIFTQLHFLFDICQEYISGKDSQVKNMKVLSYYTSTSLTSVMKKICKEAKKLKHYRNGICLSFPKHRDCGASQIVFPSNNIAIGK